ncbi:MAG: FeoB small GTPase domain-containing protein, partial [Sporomusa sp.]
MTIAKSFTIGLLGQPNTGKSTLFNQLTNMKQHVGNWPGKTVEQKSGKYLHKGSVYHIVDLPGTYSLSANSEEEIVTRTFVFSGNWDAMIVLIDASQLERSLYLLADFAGINMPVVAVLNMIDVAEQNGKTIEYKKIEEITGIPVIPMIATKGKGVAELIGHIELVINKQQAIKLDVLVQQYREAFGDKLDSVIQALSAGIGRYSPAWLGMKLMENDRQVADLVKENISKENWQKIQALITQNKNSALTAASCKYEWIKAILDGAVADKKHKFIRSRFDRLTTHPLWGIPLSLLMMLLGFLVSMVIAMPFMMTIFNLIPIISFSLQKVFFDTGGGKIFSSLITEAVIPAAFMALFMGIFVSGVSLVFGFMEDVGYMARVAYVFDG